jgi:hypothetical protein
MIMDVHSSQPQLGSTEGVMIYRIRDGLVVEGWGIGAAGVVPSYPTVDTAPLVRGRAGEAPLNQLTVSVPAMPFS